AEFQTSPSLDGSSSQFFLGGSTPYASALWWKQVGGIDSVRFLKYGVDFFFTDDNAPQALEFDVNQSVGGQKYIFGTECDFTGAKQWRVWDYYDHWQSTGVPCTALKANVWHHLTWEFERTLDNHTHFIAVTVDGWRSEEHTSELQSRGHLVCRLLLEKKKKLRDQLHDVAGVHVLQYGFWHVRTTQKVREPHIV